MDGRRGGSNGRVRSIRKTVFIVCLIMGIKKSRGTTWRRDFLLAIGELEVPILARTPGVSKLVDRDELAARLAEAKRYREQSVPRTLNTANYPRPQGRR